MAFIVGVQIEVTDTLSQQPHVRVQNFETVQIPGPFSPATGDLFASVVERLAEDVKDRAVEQARQMTKQAP